MICANIEEFNRVWGWIEKAVAVDLMGVSHSREDVLNELQSGEALLFTTPNSGILVKFIHHPQVKMINVWAAGGKMKEIVGEGLAEIEDYARQFGFQGIVGSARYSWGRVLSKKGFNAAHTTFVKDLRI